MIRHAALFRLRHPFGSPEESAFLRALTVLETIPGVQDFAISPEVSPKNDFDYTVSMIFTDAAAYQAYNDHPRHVEFVQRRWVPEVAAFLEHDTTALA
jgi:hypothetical protein